MQLTSTDEHRDGIIISTKDGFNRANIALDVINNHAEDGRVKEILTAFFGGENFDTELGRARGKSLTVVVIYLP